MRGERVRSRSLHSDMVRQKGTEMSGKKRSQSVFPQIDILEDEETEILGEFVNKDLFMNTLDTDVEGSSSTALSSNSRMTTSRILKEAEKRRKERRENRNCKRATVTVKRQPIPVVFNHQPISPQHNLVTDEMM